jgi:glycosyltransferase involved in cell wall biosynthesis
MSPSIVQMVNGLDIGGHSGGAESFGIRLSRELAKKGWSVTVCAFYQFDTEIEHKWESILDNEGINVIYIVSPGDTRYLTWLVRFYERVVTLNADLYHCHSHICTIFSAFFKLFKKMKCLIRTAHISVEFGSGWKPAFFRILFRNIIYPILLQGEVGVSQHIVDNLNSRLIARILRKKSKRIYPALPEREIGILPFGGFSRQVLSTESSWLIASVGKLTIRKRFDILICAMPEILKHVPSARLILVGNGPVYSKLAGLADELNVSKYISFLGQQDSVMDIMAQCNVFVLSSVAEGLSAVILEAFHVGIPVVASDIPGNRELIQDGYNGFLCTPLDINSFSNAVVKLYHDRALCTLYVQRSREILGRFDISIILNEYIAYYQDCCGTR